MDVLTIAENIARAVIPELEGVPLYVVPMAQAAAAFPGIGADCYGCYHPQLARALRQQLEAQGTWQGDGVAITVDMDALHLEYGGSSYAFARAVPGVVLHELTHWLLRPPLPLVAVADDDAGDVSAAIDANATQPTDGLTYAAACIASHGQRFTRIAAHASFRTSLRGPLSIAPVWLRFAACCLGLEALGEPGDYMAALASEMDSRRDDPLLAIAASDPPKEFTDLWAAGCRRLLAPLAA